MGAALQDAGASIAASGTGILSTALYGAAIPKPEMGLYDFIQRGAWAVLERKRFIPNWHLEDLCAHLEAVSAGDITHLIVNVPPGTMKSLTTCVFWPAWEWTWAPHRRWLFGSYIQTLATRDSRKMRNLLLSEWYQQHWGSKVQLASDQNLKTRFETTATGYRIAAGIHSATGERADRVVMDDPHNIKKRESDLDRASVLDSWDTTWSQRGSSEQAAFVVVMQRLHEQDLTGHLIDQQDADVQWVHLEIPMEYEPDREVKPNPIGWVDARSAKGELLWPELFPEKRVKRSKKTLGIYQAAAQLQQRPTPAGGAIIRKDWWRYWTVLPPVFDEIIQSWDMTFLKSDDASYVVGQMWGRLRAEFYLLWQVRDRVEFPDALEMVTDLGVVGRRHFARFAMSMAGKYVERKANGPAIVATLRRKVPGLIAIEPSAVAAGDTPARLRAAAPYVEAGNVLIPEPGLEYGFSEGRIGLLYDWVPDFKLELERIPKTQHDDQGAAFAQAVMILQQHAEEMSNTDHLGQEAAPRGRRSDERAMSEAAAVADPARKF